MAKGWNFLDLPNMSKDELADKLDVEEIEKLPLKLMQVLAQKFGVNLAGMQSKVEITKALIDAVTKFQIEWKQVSDEYSELVCGFS